VRLCDLAQGVTMAEAVGRQLCFFAQVFDRQPQIIRLVGDAERLARLFDAHAPLSRGAGGTFDVLVHAVQNAARKVRLRIGQAFWIVGPGRLADGEVTLTFQVFHQKTALPSGPVLNKELGEHGHQPGPVSRQFLLLV
jgi:hypothetical protein